MSSKTRVTSLVSIFLLEILSNILFPHGSKQCMKSSTSLVVFWLNATHTVFSTVSHVTIISSVPFFFMNSHT
jgi:hypothetical protein